MAKKVTFSTATLFLVLFSCASAQEAAQQEIQSTEQAKAAQSEPKVKEKSKHLFVAKLMLRRLESVDMTSEQLTAFNKLSEELKRSIEKKRAEVGITKQTIKRRDEVYSKLKKTDLKGDELWNTLQERAELTAAQRDVFRETMEHYKKFRADVLKLLTQEQRDRVPKAKKPAK